jgi:hypothetical protein
VNDQPAGFWALLGTIAAAVGAAIGYVVKGVFDNRATGASVRQTGQQQFEVNLLARIAALEMRLDAKDAEMRALEKSNVDMAKQIGRMETVIAMMKGDLEDCLGRKLQPDAYPPY